MKNPIKIAITGKIGSGKSTVAEIIKDIGPNGDLQFAATPVEDLILLLSSIELS